MTRDALDAIYRGSDGIPRLIDQLADQSLLLACQDRERPVSAAMVGRAWCMLQQLPNPWSEPESIVKGTSASAASMATSMTQGVQTPPVGMPQARMPRTQTPMSDLASSAPMASAPMASALPRSSSSTISSSTISAPKISAPAAISSPSSMVSEAGFQAMMKGTSALQMSAPSISNIEFGELGDDFLDESEAGQYDHIGPSATIDRRSTVASNFEEPVEMRNSPAPKSKNMLDVFAGDFDEEFSIPVQSSDSYHAYSGASYGNLNYDLSNFGTANRQSMEEQPLAFDEASDFLPASTQPAYSSQRNMPSPYEPTYADSMELAMERDFAESSYENSEMETISNISPEQAANLERQIEEEMRELVSDLNLSAMTFDPLLDQSLCDANRTTRQSSGRSAIGLSRTHRCDRFFWNAKLFEHVRTGTRTTETGHG